jgi:hypothetical protein
MKAQAVIIRKSVLAKTPKKPITSSKNLSIATLIILRARTKATPRTIGMIQDSIIISERRKVAGNKNGTIMVSFIDTLLESVYLRIAKRSKDKPKEHKTPNMMKSDFTEISGNILKIISRTFACKK